jgi:hypothetical protein
MRSVLVSVAGLALVLVTAAAAEAATPATVRIVERDPLTFKGRHFHAGERVRLDDDAKAKQRGLYELVARLSSDITLGNTTQVVNLMVTNH